ncbi:hypothetical protein CJ030_MR4G007294 [Morella rubra]|uniref:Uncharacterized protein n=1 Tax=Morella rubra TaxID=262757 RepID=A0A6A1VUB4_9ROSI|nr:hypothetical protein CJ030_MR4G007294 [Morella rubra]
METQISGLQPFLTTTPGTLRVMSRRLGAIEDQLRKDERVHRGGIQSARYGEFEIRLSIRLAIDCSGKRITKAGGLIERPA